MLLLIGLTVLLLVSGYLTHLADLEPWAIVPCTIALLSAAVLLLLIVGLPINRMEVSAKLDMMEEMQKTADRAREEGDSLEGMGFRKEIAEYNTWLRSTQYYNNTVFDMWIPDEVETAKPIQ